MSKIISSNQGLREWVAKTKPSGRLALDTEFMRQNTYYPRLCLMQIACGEEVACIDPLAVNDLSPLTEWLQDQSIIKVLHSARQDIEVLYQHLNVIPSPLFDTQIAAAFCGYGEQSGYAALVDILCDEELQKTETRTDWCKRPLSSKQLNYAADDVRYLLPLQQQLTETLKSSRRLAWLNEECERLLAPTLYRTEPETAFQRLSGGGLAIPAQHRLRALCEWREHKAQQQDRPREWILGDKHLFTLANSPPEDLTALYAIPELPRPTTRRWGKEISLLLTNNQTEKAEKPVWRENDMPNQQQRKLLKKLRSIAKAQAEKLNIPQSLLASRSDLQKLVMGDRDVLLLASWRKTVIGELLLAEIAVY